MAKAPTPGSSGQPANHNFLKLRLLDETREVNLTVSLKEAFVIRNVTGGIPLEQLVAAFGMDSFAVLWWLARRQTGEPNLAWNDFAEEWGDIAPTLGEGDFDLDPVDIEGEPVEDDSPEGDGPAS